jgi:hypothetical protein
MNKLRRSISGKESLNLDTAESPTKGVPSLTQTITFIHIMLYYLQDQVWQEKVLEMMEFADGAFWVAPTLLARTADPLRCPPILAWLLW